MSFSANPRLFYNGKKFDVFAASDAIDGVFTLDTTSAANAIVYIDANYLNTLTSGSEIGLAHITVVNWTSEPNLTDKVILCQSIPNVFTRTGGYSSEVGVFAPYIVEHVLTQIINTENSIDKNVLNNAFIEPYPAFDIDIQYSKLIFFLKSQIMV